MGGELGWGVGVWLCKAGGGGGRALAALAVIFGVFLSAARNKILVVLHPLFGGL